MLPLLFAASATALFQGLTPAKAPQDVSKMRGKVVPTGPQPDAPSEIETLAKDVSITALRIATCSLMYHHGIDKIQVRRLAGPKHACVVHHALFVPCAER